MSWFCTWLTGRRWMADDTSAEAQEHLEHLSRNGDEVERLGKELRDTHARNNFSAMVASSMKRRRREEGT